MIAYFFIPEVLPNKVASSPNDAILCFCRLEVLPNTVASGPSSVGTVCIPKELCSAQCWCFTDFFCCGGRSLTPNKMASGPGSGCSVFSMAEFYFLRLKVLHNVVVLHSLGRRSLIPIFLDFTCTWHFFFTYHTYFL